MRTLVAGSRNLVSKQRMRDRQRLRDKPKFLPPLISAGTDLTRA